jgi:hypothetical protein
VLPRVAADERRDESALKLDDTPLVADALAAEEEAEAAPGEPLEDLS